MSHFSARSINILFIAAEADPFIKVGGLGDYAGSLPLALRNLSPGQIQNHEIDVRLAIPFHGRISAKKWGVRFLTKYTILEKRIPVIVKVYVTQFEGLPVYLIGRNRRAEKKSSIYSEKSFINSRKYAFFSIACLELMKHIGWKADIVHANDWHTAFSILKIVQLKKKDLYYANIKSLLTIHNLAFMGAGSENTLKSFQLDPIKDASLPAWAETQPLPMGLSLSDDIVTVSPTYSKEIKTHQFGYGLEKLFKKRSKSVFGILNGIDYQKWDPQHDQKIENHYSAQNIQQRLKNKKSLQKQFGLSSQDIRIPLVIMISRLDIQKGIDLLLDGFDSFSDIPLQLIILGAGNKNIEKDCKNLEDKFPEKVRVLTRYDELLARKLYSGAEMILIPSRYEPCGTTQMIAMRYGCIPVARATGGLKDSIQDGINGFLFNDPTSLALAKAIKKAIYVFQNKSGKWEKMQIQAMNSDFSWNNSALLYAKQYIKLLSF
jgi:starch synthase